MSYIIFSYVIFLLRWLLLESVSQGISCNTTVERWFIALRSQVNKVLMLVWLSTFYKLHDILPVNNLRALHNFESNLWIRLSPLYYYLGEIRNEPVDWVDSFDTRLIHHSIILIFSEFASSILPSSLLLMCCVCV